MLILVFIVDITATGEYLLHIKHRKLHKACSVVQSALCDEVNILCREFASMGLRSTRDASVHTLLNLIIHIHR